VAFENTIYLSKYCSEEQEARQAIGGEERQDTIELKEY
jgi:hypothetical protein